MLELKPSSLQSSGFDLFPSDYFADQIDREKTLCFATFFEFFAPVYGDRNLYSPISNNSWYYEGNKWGYDAVVEVVINLAPRNLLEIGCGNRHLLEKILSLGVDVEGIDINKDAVEACNAKGLCVNAANIFDLTKTYDIVALFEVLERMENVRELFTFLTTKLIRPGAYLIIAAPNPDGYLKGVDVNFFDMLPLHNSS